MSGPFFNDPSFISPDTACRGPGIVGFTRGLYFIWHTRGAVIVVLVSVWGFVMSAVMLWSLDCNLQSPVLFSGFPFLIPDSSETPTRNQESRIKNQESVILEEKKLNCNGSATRHSSIILATVASA